MLWSLQFALDESLVDGHLRSYIGQFTLPPRFHLPSHTLEVPLHPIHTDGNAVDEGERHRVLGQHRSMHSRAREAFQALLAGGQPGHWVDRMQRNFGPLKQQVEQWRLMQLSALRRSC